MAARKRKSDEDGSNPAGVLKTDDGGRPVTDDGGRLVFTDRQSGAEQLDPAGTPPTEPQSA